MRRHLKRRREELYACEVTKAHVKQFTQAISASYLNAATCDVMRSLPECSAPPSPTRLVNRAATSDKLVGYKEAVDEASAALTTEEDQLLIKEVIGHGGFGCGECLLVMGAGVDAAGCFRRQDGVQRWRKTAAAPAALAPSLLPRTTACCMRRVHHAGAFLVVVLADASPHAPNSRAHLSPSQSSRPPGAVWKWQSRCGEWGAPRAELALGAQVMVACWANLLQTTSQPYNTHTNPLHTCCFAVHRVFQRKHGGQAPKGRDAA